VTEIVKIPGRGHALTIDGGWREVAQVSLAFVQRYLPSSANMAVPIVGDIEMQGSSVVSPNAVDTNA
jgi:hypothetical protein